MLNKKIIVMSVVVGVLSACGSTEKKQTSNEFNISQKLMMSQKYVEAVSYLEKAVNKDPDNRQYAAMLAKARKKSVEQLISRMNNTLTEGSLNKAKLDSARTLLNKAKSILPQHSAYADAEAVLANKQEALQAKVKALYANVKKNITNQNWIKAKFAVKKIIQLFPNYEDTTQLSQKIKIAGSRFYLQKANDAYRINDFVTTLAFARKAITIKSDNQRAKQLISSTNKKNNKEYFISLAQSAALETDWATVYRSCKKVLSYDANNAFCIEEMANAKDKWTSTLLTKARQSMTNGYLAKSIDIYIEAEVINDGVKNNALSAFKASLSDKIDIKADELIELNKDGSAWYLLNRIKEINPYYPDLFEKIKEIEDAITLRIRKQIAVFDFKSPSYSQDAGVLVANNLIANLFNSASKDIIILERENLKSILEEMKLGQIGVVSESSAQEMGRLYGIDTAIMGSVLLYKVDTSESISSETVRYSIGEEISDNIDYLNWRALNPKPSKAELRTAPPAKIMVPKYGEKEYKVTSMKKVGFFQLSFKIVDFATGANVRVETIKRQKVVEDNSNEGIKDANVIFDPLEISTDTELLQSMAAEVVEELSRGVLQPLRNLEKKYFEDGEALYLRRKENLNAVEEFVNAIFDEKLKSVVNSPITIQANKYLETIITEHAFK
jgi:tetratricopeptide (TPR) repeat protein